MAQSSGAPTRRKSLPSSIQTGKEIGSGGEGAVFELVGLPGLVAKVYHQPPSPEKQRKLRVMAKMDVGALGDLAAWPVDIVGSGGADVNGFIMQRISGHMDVHFLYGPKSRREKFGDVDFRFVVRAASNIAKTFAIAHAAGVVIGDVNFGGVTVSKQATVKLLDCDSFQIEQDGKVYHCDVAMPLFTPPEVAGRPLNTTRRTPNHDNFGLAVLIFHLLMMGRHPFAGRFSGHGDMPPEKAIADFRYAYGPRAEAMKMAPPPGVPAVERVAGQAIADAFEKAFDMKGPSGSRPDALRWSGLLDDLFAGLQKCDRNPGHWAVEHGECPWCMAEEASGVSIFGKATTAIAATISSARELAVIAGMISRVTLPGVSKASLPAVPKLPTKPTRFPKLKLLAKVCVILGSVWAGNQIAWFWTTALALSIFGLRMVNFVFDRRWFVTARRKTLLRERKTEVAAHDTALRMYLSLCEEQNAVFANHRDEALAVYEKLKAVPKEREMRIRNLHVDQPGIQLGRYLQQFSIDDAKIPGVGEARKALLEEHGYRTAADVNQHMSADVPGFGEVLVDAMLAWRKRMSAGFVFDPSISAKREDIEKLHGMLDLRERGYERQILAAKPTLERLKGVFMQRRSIAHTHVLEHLASIAKIDAELSA